MEPLTLYVDAFFISPYAFSAFVALEEKGLPFSVKPVALHLQEHRTQQYLEDSLTGRIPALQHGEWWLSESGAISEYLAETFPFPKYPRIFPENLRERARARQLMAWLRTDLMPMRMERPSRALFYSLPQKPLSPEGKTAVASFLRVMEEVIREDRTTLFNSWCIADAELGMMLKRLIHHGDAVTPKVADYAAAQWERPSVKKFVERERLPWVVS